jgi:hypothetical protein
MLTAKFINAYTSKTGSKRARYRVSGSTTELDAYKAAQGQYLTYDDDGVTPIIFADCPLDESATYKVKFWEAQNRYLVDFSAITSAAGAIETAEKRGNSRLADQIASRQADKLMGSTITSSASSALQEAVAQAPEPANLQQPITAKGRNK